MSIRANRRQGYCRSGVGLVLVSLMRLLDYHGSSRFTAFHARCFIAYCLPEVFSNGECVNSALYSSVSVSLQLSHLFWFLSLLTIFVDDFRNDCVYCHSYSPVV